MVEFSGPLMFETSSQGSGSQLALNGPHGLPALVDQPTDPTFSNGSAVVNDDDCTVGHLDQCVSHGLSLLSGHSGLWAVIKLLPHF